MKILLASALLLLTSCQMAHRIDAKSFLTGVDNAQQFTLLSADGTSYQLSDLYQSHKGLVLAFWQNGCPCVKRYQERWDLLFEKYSQEGLAFVYISSNTNESFSAVLQEADKRSIKQVILRDEGGKLAQALNVKGTPSTVLLDEKGDVKFMGWLDNERKIGEPNREAYLENAILDFLANKAIKKPSAPMFGCKIR